MQNKILHITQFLSPGGLERMIWNLSVELKRQGHVSEVFVYDQEGEKTLLPEFINDGIAVHVEKKENGFSYKTVKALRHLITSGKFTAIHSHDLGALIYASFASFGLRNVVHVHTQHSFIHFRKSWVQPIYERFFCKFPDTIVTVSPHQLNDYKKIGVNAVNITNGIQFPDQSPYTRPLIERKKSLLEQVKFQQSGLFGARPDVNKKWILYPGRIQKSKGQILLFEILKHLTAEEKKQFQFLFLGAPTFESERALLQSLYEADSSNADVISYLGFQSNPLEWMTCSAGVVLLSEFEGFPLVPLESLGLGIPTLLSDIAPHRFLQSDVTLCSLRDLTPAINWVKECLQTTSIQWDSRADFRKNYSIERMAHEYIALYENRK